MICRRSFRLSSSPVTRSHRSTQETRGMSRIYERKAVKLTGGRGNNAASTRSACIAGLHLVVYERNIGTNAGATCRLISRCV